MSTSVKFITSDMRGAPTINGTAGTLISALDTLFVSGWGGVTALSITVSSGVATATMTSGQTFFRDSVILIEGATPAPLNGEARVLTSDATTMTWATAAVDGAATGTITIKNAPQTSWEKKYAATNKAAYQSQHVESTGHFLRVDDTGTTSARIRGFETMTDVNTGTGPFPTDAQHSGGGYWYKSLGADSNATKWAVFCDERFVLTALSPGSSSDPLNTAAHSRGFGDPLVLAPGGDTWGTLVSVQGSNSAAALAGAFDTSGSASADGASYFPRHFSGLGGGYRGVSRSFIGALNGTSGMDSTLGAAPSSVDGKLRPSRIFVRQYDAGTPPRVVVPGVYYLPHSGTLSLLAHGDFLEGSGDLAGRRLMVLSTTSYGANSPPDGCYVVDITGPWR